MTGRNRQNFSAGLGYDHFSACVEILLNAFFQRMIFIKINEENKKISVDETACSGQNFCAKKPNIIMQNIGNR